MIFDKSGWLKGYENDKFEQQFFYFLPHEFKLLDSHQRLSFEVEYETFEDNINTFDAHTPIGISSSIVVNRLSYFYNLLGPSFIIDTTCSSTLFSLNCACQSICSGESSSTFCVRSPDGQCKTFGASVDGYVRSEVIGISIWRIIVEYDTGTFVSDPVECKSIRHILNVGRQRGRPIIVGSVKSNVGHLEPAAGIVSLIKVAYTLKHNLIPPTISAHTLYPRIDMKALNLKNVIQIQSLPAAANENQLRTGTVSAFEFREPNLECLIQQYTKRQGMFDCIQGESQIGECAEILAVSGWGY
ncbi:MAG: putative type I polyketide synthase [Streblomastix strix]|uniref:Putative type I polyketide synthase n=2 Tax=Streblomastix strix TaxID=222440 RepID=A0A5J4VDD2_9EUKA|nr:MAG: putative type I polyketide synthase [Streblomastix strix]